jgi:hypothetical protein
VHVHGQVLETEYSDFGTRIHPRVSVELSRRLRLVHEEMGS